MHAVRKHLRRPSSVRAGAEQRAGARTRSSAPRCSGTAPLRAAALAPGAGRVSGVAHTPAAQRAHLQEYSFKTSTSDKCRVLMSCGTRRDVCCSESTSKSIHSRPALPSRCSSRWSPRRLLRRTRTIPAMRYSRRSRHGLARSLRCHLRALRLSALCKARLSLAASTLRRVLAGRQPALACVGGRDAAAPADAGSAAC